MNTGKINFRYVYASEPKSITMVFTGDVMLGRLVNQSIRVKGYEYPWGDTLAIINNSDLSFVNLECVIAKMENHGIRHLKYSSLELIQRRSTY